MKLYLMRHGEAVAEYVDPQRPLRDDGRVDVEKIAGSVKSKGITVNEIYHSSKLRAKQTAEIVRGVISPESQMIEKSYLSPNDSIDRLMEDLIDRNEDLMVVGHLPFLPRLASQLVKGNEEKYVVSLPTSSVVALERDSQSSWKVLWIMTPHSIELNE